MKIICANTGTTTTLTEEQEGAMKAADVFTDVC